MRSLRLAISRLRTSRGIMKPAPNASKTGSNASAIEYAISRKLQTFEGGAQGEHKLFRGLMPVETLSAHWLAHPKFARAVETFLEREGAGIARYVNELTEHSPFKETS